MEIIERLLSEGYVSYGELCERQGALAGEALWMELERERKRWRMTGTLVKDSDYLCMTPYVLMRRCTLLALLSHMQAAYHAALEPLAWSECLRRELAGQGLLFDAKGLLHQELKTAAADPLLVLFCLVLHERFNALSLCRLWQECLIAKAPLEPSCYLPDALLDLDLYERSDKTYLFLRFLSQLELNFKECLLLLKRDCGDYLRMTKEQLAHRCPHLSKQQIAFFVAHRSEREYYSIQEYMCFENVCYETARQAMEGLHQIGWYRRRKIGKRFYYTTVSGYEQGVL